MGVALTSPLADEAHVTIPDMLISHQTLKYLGLSDSKAATLWDLWFHWDADDGIGRYEIDQDCDMEVEFTRMWMTRATMPSGVLISEAAASRKSVENAIMDPEFKALRLSCSGFYWIEDTMRMRYAGLEEMQRTSLAREEKISRGDDEGQHKRCQGSHQTTGNSLQSQQPLGPGQSSFNSSTG